MIQISVSIKNHGLHILSRQSPAKLLSELAKTFRCVLELKQIFFSVGGGGKSVSRLMDELRIYDEPLGVSEIKRLYREVAGVNTSPVLVIPRRSQEVSIDGKLEPSEWSGAAETTGFSGIVMGWGVAVVRGSDRRRGRRGSFLGVGIRCWLWLGVRRYRQHQRDDHQKSRHTRSHESSCSFEDRSCHIWTRRTIRPIL